MSLASVERKIWKHSQQFFNNRSMRLKDLMEWSTSPIEPHEGEVTAKLPSMSNIYVSVKNEIDKRKKG